MEINDGGALLRGGLPTASVDREAAKAESASRRWRTIWRTHFYAGVFAAPFLVMMALTGLVILYTQPINDTLQRDLRVVAAGTERVPFGQQEAAVTAALPDRSVTSLTVPRDATASSEFGLDDGNSAFVNPYTGKFLGTTDPGGGIVGFANRLHGVLNNDTASLSLPNPAFLLDGGPVVRPFIIGDMLLEIAAVWSLVLVLSGMYLWWPRHTRSPKGTDGKARFVPRIAKKGRARWRDLHAIPGIVFAVVSIFVVTSGLFWSSFWAESYTALANKITPGTDIEVPASTLATRGDLDRLGNHINWNTADRPLPASDAPDPTTLPARASIDTIVAASEQEQMKPGYTVYYPADETDDVGNTVYGSFTVSNSWPRKTGEARDVYFDQFSAKTLGSADVYGYGAVSRASDTLVSTHMGTQLGLFSRIVMTAVCLAIIWSVISAVVMFVKRRRKGSLGLPRRPRDLRLANGLIAIFVVVAFVYPLWGVTALAILLLDRFVIRRVPKLRATFGQR